MNSWSGMSVESGRQRRGNSKMMDALHFPGLLVSAEIRPPKITYRCIPVPQGGNVALRGRPKLCVGSVGRRLEKKTVYL